MAKIFSDSIETIQFPNSRNIYMPSIIDNYIHSNVSGFLETSRMHDLQGRIDSINNSLVEHAKPIIKELEAWYRDMRKAEKNFSDKMRETNPSLANKQSVLKFLNNMFFNQQGNQKKLFDAWTAAKVAITSNSRVRAATEKSENEVQEEKQLKAYEKHINEIFTTINNFEEAYSQFVKQGNEKSFQQYNRSIKKLKSLSKMKGMEKIKSSNWSGLTQEERRSKLNELYSKIIKASAIDLGWTFEPVTKEALALLNTKLVGAEYAGSLDTVVDLTIEIDSQIQQYGINVKSSQEQYKIARSNNDNINKINQVFGKSAGVMRYVRNNLMALTSFAAPYTIYSDFQTRFRKLYESYKNVERKLAFVFNIMSALDGIREQIDNSKKTGHNIYSILILYQGGFIWTSSVIKDIIDGLPIFLSGETLTETGMEVISRYYVTYNRHPRSQLQSHYNQKRSVFNQIRKRENLDQNNIIYSELAASSSHNLSDIPLASQIFYTVNLSKVGKRQGGAK